MNVKKIERVQNPELYRTFKVKKQEMDKRYGGNSERKLFHGTDGKSIDAINARDLTGASVEEMVGAFRSRLLVIGAFDYRLL